MRTWRSRSCVSRFKVCRARGEMRARAPGAACDAGRPVPRVHADAQSAADTRCRSLVYRARACVQQLQILAAQARGTWRALRRWVEAACACERGLNGAADALECSTRATTPPIPFCERGSLVVTRALPPRERKRSYTSASATGEESMRLLRYTEHRWTLFLSFVLF